MNKQTNRKTQIQRVMDILSKGKKVSTALLRSRGIASPSGVICHIRDSGVRVDTVTSEHKGKTRYAYVLNS